MTGVLIYCILFIFLLVLAFRRPVWGVGFYMLNFFALPDYWYWGQGLPQGIRWSLVGGCVLLVSVLMSGVGSTMGNDRDSRRTGKIILLMLLNATLVHVALSMNWANSVEDYAALAKFVLLYFLIVAAIRTRQDFSLLLMFLLVGGAYWGFEARFHGIELVDGRLEGFGGPGCSNSNELASIVVTLLPLVGGMLFLFQGWQRVFVFLAAPLMLNLVMLCNSRGGLLGLIAAAIVLPAVAPVILRKKALAGLALGGLAAWLLMGDVRIKEHFLTIFQSKEEAQEDARSRIAYGSAHGRIEFWKAGLSMLGDYPLGRGGNAFLKGGGTQYLMKYGAYAGRDRALHQGALKEATDWGLQGLALRMALLVSAAVCAYKTTRFQIAGGDHRIAFFGCCIIASFAGFFVTTLFGDDLHLEWGYWIVTLAVVYANIYGPNSGQMKLDARDSIICEYDLNYEPHEQLWPDRDTILSSMHGVSI